MLRSALAHALFAVASCAPLAEISQRLELPLTAEDAFPVDELSKRVTEVRGARSLSPLPSGLVERASTPPPPPPPPTHRCGACQRSSSWVMATLPWRWRRSFMRPGPSRCSTCRWVHAGCTVARNAIPRRPRLIPDALASLSQTGASDQGLHCECEAVSCNCVRRCVCKAGSVQQAGSSSLLQLQESLADPDAAAQWESVFLQTGAGKEALECDCERIKCNCLKACQCAMTAQPSFLEAESPASAEPPAAQRLTVSVQPAGQASPSRVP